MTDTLNQLILTLREELQQYGEMLALLDQQQEFVVNRTPDEVLHIVGAIQTQSGVIQHAREKREEVRRELAGALRQPAHTGFAQLIPLLPDDYRPLIRALVEENNGLLQRVQQRARQNHLLLSRSVEMLQRFLNNLLPALTPKVYNDNGGVTGASLPAHSLYEAVV